MAQYIQLHDGQGALGEFNLPARIEINPGSYFSLGSIRKGGGNGVVFEARHYQNFSLITGSVKYFTLKMGHSGQKSPARPVDCKAFDAPSNKRTCALKFLRRLDAPRVDRFKNEVRIINELGHDNIATYYGQGSLKLAGMTFLG